MKHRISAALMGLGLLIALFATCLGCGVVVKTLAGTLAGEWRPAVYVYNACPGQQRSGSGGIATDAVTCGGLGACGGIATSLLGMEWIGD